MDNDFTSLRLRVLQLEATLKGRDREYDKLARTVETLKAESHEVGEWGRGTAAGGLYLQ